ncbi:MAG: oligopeptide transporter, OPT family [Gemmatimonadetes bacterium]|nr:oligopeptide transporter, OPT family [Gemmatimonadota bacterium]
MQFPSRFGRFSPAGRATTGSRLTRGSFPGTFGARAGLEHRAHPGGGMSEFEVRRGGLPPQAYEQIPGDQYPPYIAASENIPEFTMKAVVIGLVLAIVFGAANAYLGLRVGLTVSASIPAAVMAVGMFRLVGRGTILETNIVQTIASAGESVAAGVIFTLPALLMWQREDPSISADVLEISVIALLGGVLGVLMMIPLRRYLIAREHGVLPFPEGTACAEVQVAGQQGGKKAGLLFQGLGLGAVYQAFSNGRGLGLWNPSPAMDLPRKAQIAGDFTPELLGVGFIIGPAISAVMFAGGALAWLILIPAIDAWGGTNIVYPATVPMNTMGSGDIWNSYIRYVGAGAVGFAGIVTLIKSIPTIMESFRLGFQNLGGAGSAAVPRTERDIPMPLVVGLSALIAIAIWLFPGLPVNLLGGVLIVIFSFFFVTVSSRIVGLIGSSSNPVSGMTIAALILTSLIWVALGLNDGSVASKAAVLTVGAVVCISAAMAGDTSQDLKTGFLLGATPSLQQWGLVLGVVASGSVMGFILIVLDQSYGIGTATGLPAPQATLMSLVIDGVLQGSLPWTFVILGAAISAVVEFVFKQPALAFAVGLYLPVSLSTPVLIGGLMRWGISRKWDGVSVLASDKREQGILFASGLIAGSALVGVIIGGLIYGVTQATGDPAASERWIVGEGWTHFMPHGSEVVGTALFALLCWTLWHASNKPMEA